MRSGGRKNPLVLLFLSSHPGPSLAVAVICVVLGITSGLAPWRIAVLGAAILFGQFSVGLSNDWLDADRDRRAFRRDKPVALGQITLSTVRTAALLTGAVGLAATVFLGWQATLAHALFLCSGWSYNLWLKRTAFSVVPYFVGFGALPATVTLAAIEPQLPVLWIVTAGALLGVAAHFANALPDLDDDRMTGIVGLPHRVGARASGIVTFAALAAASALAVTGAAIFGDGRAPGVVGWIALGAEAAIVVAGVALVLTRDPGRPLFRLVILGALVAVVSLALSGGQLTAS